MLIEIDDVIKRLYKLQRFNLDNYVENEFSVETIRDNDGNGDYIEAYEIDCLITELEENDDETR